MLAQNFKSASDLDLNEQEKEALVKTLVLLETGKLTHTPAFFNSYAQWHCTFTGHFNMDSWCNVATCGTVACIGGTAELVGNLEPGCLAWLRDSGAEKLHDLFCPDVPTSSWKYITTQQAAKALRSYLTTGEARWDLALGD